MASPRQPLGPYLGNSGEITPGGALYFLNPTTDIPKVLYTDIDLTVLAPNPSFLDSSGRTSDQLFYDEGNYKVQQFVLVDPDMVSPVFPADYALIKEWEDEAYPGSGSAVGPATVNSIVVDTIADLTDNVSPTEYTMVGVIGYYTRNDQIDTRVYYWDSLSALSADGGSVIQSSLIGTGRWILKTESPVVDVRHFGAIPGSGFDCNSGITSACAFAVSGSNVKPLSVYFPQGTYIVVPGTIQTVATVKIDELATFFNRIAGTFFLDVQLGWDIDKNSPMQNGSSTGASIVRFDNSTWGLLNDTAINTNWFESVDKCLLYSGTNPIRISGPVTALTTQNYTNKNLVFTGPGKLTLDNGSAFSLTVSSVSFQNTNQIFDFTFAGFTLLGFDASVDIHSSWFGASNDLLKLSAKTGCGLVLNSTVVLATSYVLDLTLLSYVRSAGGLYTLSGGTNLSLPQNLIGKVIDLSLASDTTALSVTGAALSSTNFFLTNTAAVRAFARIAMGSQSQVIFNGELFNFAVNFDGLGGVDVVNMSTTGTLDVSDVSTFTKCKIRTGAFSSSSASLILNDCIFAPASISSNAVDNISMTGTTFTHLGASLTTGVFSASDSAITMVSAITIGSTLTTVDNCSLTLGTTGSNTSEFSSADMEINNSTLNDFKVVATMSGSNSVKLKFEGNQCDGSFIGPEGVTGGVQHIYIRNNHFSNSNALTLYLPIVHSGFSATSELVTRGIDISGNTPLIDEVFVDEDQVTLPNLITTGTRVLQTNFDFKMSVTTGIGLDQFGIPVNPTQQNFLWLPASLYTIGSSNTKVQKSLVSVAAFSAHSASNGTDLWINDYILNDNQQSTISYDNINFRVEYVALLRVQATIDFFKH